MFSTTFYSFLEILLWLNVVISTSALFYFGKLCFPTKHITPCFPSLALSHKLVSVFSIGIGLLNF